MRQLHLYGFKIVKNSQRHAEYRNSMFRRGQYCDLPNLKKKVSRKLRISKIQNTNLDVAAEYAGLEDSIRGLEESIRRVGDQTAAMIKANAAAVRTIINQQLDFESLARSSLFSFFALVEHQKLSATKVLSKSQKLDFASLIGQECQICNLFKNDFSRHCVSNIRTQALDSLHRGGDLPANVHHCARHLASALANDNYEGVLGVTTNCAFNIFSLADEGGDERASIRDSIDAQVRDCLQLVAGGRLSALAAEPMEDDTIADGESRASCNDTLVDKKINEGGPEGLDNKPLVRP